MHQEPVVLHLLELQVISTGKTFFNIQQVLEYFGLIDSESQPKETFAKETVEDLLKHITFLKANATDNSFDFSKIIKLLKFLIKSFNDINNLILDFLNSIKDDLDQFTPKANYFSPKLAEEKLVNTKMNFGDAGLADNFGLMALLRRNVKKIVVFVNTNVELQVNEKNQITQMDDSVKAFFGKASPASSALGIQLDNLKVFPKKDFHELEKQLVAQYNKQDTLYAITKLKVEGNAHWDVKPREEKVEIMWYYTSRPAKWESQVDRNFLNELDQHKDTIIGRFPFYETFSVTMRGLEPFEINTAAHLAEWHLENTDTELQKFFNFKNKKRMNKELAEAEV